MFNVENITFYKYNENGEDVLNEDGTTKEFILKDDVRFKPLEYLCQDMKEEMLTEIETK
tara:strand:- start:381 stop:557 length:177 start_codon:yes stop_codon:yes gene_type:complete